MKIPNTPERNAIFIFKQKYNATFFKDNKNILHFDNYFQKVFDIFLYLSIQVTTRSLIMWDYEFYKSLCDYYICKQDITVRWTLTNIVFFICPIFLWTAATLIKTFILGGLDFTTSKIVFISRFYCIKNIYNSKNIKNKRQSL